MDRFRGNVSQNTFVEATEDFTRTTFDKFSDSCLRQALNHFDPAHRIKELAIQGQTNGFRSGFNCDIHVINHGDTRHIECNRLHSFQQGFGCRQH